MENKNRMVIPLSTVKAMLEEEGWTFYRTFNKEYIFKGEGDEVLALPQNPNRPRLIYLDELLQCTQVLRKEFVKVSRSEWNITGEDDGHDALQFDLWVDPGEANGVEINALLTALSDLNRAAGGFGLSFNESEEMESCPESN
ncbi:MAG: hypothetical protein GY869_24860 [Planctomycetes bacterium]|nr:hypothetical protein [Planctomycetota bacterium]